MGNIISSLITFFFPKPQNDKSIKDKKSTSEKIEDNFKKFFIDQSVKDLPSLTEDDKALVIDSWSYQKECKQQVGVDLFINLFEEFPETKRPFTDFKGIDAEELYSSDNFKQHALRVVNFVEKVIYKLDDIKKLHFLAYSLGIRHSTYEVTTESIDLVGSPLIDAMKLNHPTWSQEIEKAWLKVYTIFALIVKDGIDAN